MAKKSTEELLKELQNCDTFKSYHVNNIGSYTDSTLSDMLKEHIQAKSLKKTDVIRRAEISEVYGFQIFSGERKPERNKLLCLCIAMALSLDEIQELLKKSGYSQLYVKNPVDCIIIYGICKGLSVADINFMLYDYDLQTL